MVISRDKMPTLLGTFDLRAELDAAKARIPSLSANNWTDVSESDPGIVAMRFMLEFTERYLYSASVRNYPADLAVFLGVIRGVPPLPASKAGGTIRLSVSPGTQVQLGFLLVYELTGREYATVAAATAVSGVLEVEVAAVVAGLEGNVFETGQRFSVRSTPTSGQVNGAINATSLDGGDDGETFDQYLLRFPSAEVNSTLNLPLQFETAAQSVAGVTQARVYRATRPVRGGGAGEFTSAPNHVLVVCAGAGGAAPSGSVITAVQTKLAEDSWFNSQTVSGREYVHVRGVRTRLVTVLGTLYVLDGFDPTFVASQARLAVLAYLNPLTGGRNGTGYEIGGKVWKSELYKIAQSVEGVAYIDDATFSVTDVSNLGIDELIGPNTATAFVGRLAV
jgi:uncharacterized phage protein gp47/JayE